MFGKIITFPNNKTVEFICRKSDGIIGWNI